MAVGEPIHAWDAPFEAIGKSFHALYLIDKVHKLSEPPPTHPCNETLTRWVPRFIITFATISASPAPFYLTIDLNADNNRTKCPIRMYVSPVCFSVDVL